MKRIFIYLASSLFLCACSSKHNLLVGQWEFDGNSTLDQLIKSEDAPEKLVECYKLKACGHGVVFTYTNTEWTQYFTFSPNDVAGPFGYTHEEISKNKYLISTVSNGEPVTYTMYFESAKSAYIDMDVEGYRWKEYLVRKP